VVPWCGARHKRISYVSGVLQCVNIYSNSGGADSYQKRGGGKWQYTTQL